jgi:hypothetical protein
MNLSTHHPYLASFWTLQAGLDRDRSGATKFRYIGDVTYFPDLAGLTNLSLLQSRYDSDRHELILVTMYHLRQNYHARRAQSICFIYPKENLGLAWTTVDL